MKRATKSNDKSKVKLNLFCYLMNLTISSAKTKRKDRKNKEKCFIFTMKKNTAGTKRAQNKTSAMTLMTGRLFRLTHLKLITINYNHADPIKQNK